MSQFSTSNPATGEILKNFQHSNQNEALKLIAAAHEDFNKWRKTTFEQRQAVILKLAGLLREHKELLSKTMHLEMGKLLAEAKAEVEKCAVTCEFYAEQAPVMLQNQVVKNTPYSSAEVSFQPLGIIFSIMPWNFPLWQCLRFAAPVLMAGNVIVLKHADLTAGTAEILNQIFDQLSAEYKLLRNIYADHDLAAEIIAHPQVRAVTFTGSSQGGRSVAQEAAKNLKKIVLELGGSDAYLVLKDADLTKAAKLSAKARLQNCGQSCVAAKRFIVDSAVAEGFLDLLQKEMKDVELAPLAHKKFQEKIIQQVEALKKMGGKVLLGGSAPQGPGAFYPATILVFEKNVPEAHQEEVFGPVAMVFISKNENEALEIANSSPYGLGGGIFTKDLKKGKELIEKELQAGFVVVNDYVKSDAHIPFGGIKDSGYGRELGQFGLMEFVNIKTVAVARELS